MTASTFRETVTNADGSTAGGMCSEAHAWSLLQRAVRHGYTVEATRTGGAVIVRPIGLGARHTVTLEPSAPVRALGDRTRLDLQAIGGRDGRSPARVMHGRICAGLYSVPPAASAVLVSRGLVSVSYAGGSPETVTLTLAARLAMLAQDHRTTTSEPAGYAYPLDLAYRDSLRTGQPVTLTTYSGGVGLNKPGRRAGKVYDRTSLAVCSCRGWSYPAEGRDDARRRAHQHRQEVTAAFVRALADEVLVT